MIEVPPKIWQPKVVSCYTTPLLDDGGMYDILNYTQYGKCVYKQNLNWSRGSERNDLISYKCSKHATELKKDLKFDQSVDNDTKKAITDIAIEF